ncbi:MAG: 4-phosphopantetheinyl transferase family protein [Flavobacteriales bacterium]|nr:4-phosphopantetheinyl transferase family protein [Flavobacteriales bacterium]
MNTTIGLVGNDIMDLKDAFNLQSFNNPRYLAKVMTPGELSIIREGTSLFYIPQLIWTIKESAYKLMVKRGLRKRFNPVNFEVFNISDNCKGPKLITSSVVFDQCVFHACSECTDDYIHTWVGTSNRWAGLRRRVLSKQKGSDERSELKHDLANYLKLESSRLSVVKGKDTGIPSIIVDQENPIGDFSMSHDGDYISYVYNAQAITIS